MMILKKGAQVKIISGKDKGKTGEILEINRKHTKPTKENKGGIVSKESFIHQSNVKNVDVKKDEKKIGKK
jgi:large subunit ribosomal protein L24